MHKDIADYLTGNYTANTYTLCSVKKEFIIYMAAYEVRKAIIAVNQISAHIVTVITAIHIHFTIYSVCSVCRQTGLYCFVLSKKKNSNKIKAFLSRCKITLIKTCATQYTHIVKLNPRVISILAFCEIAYTLHQRHVKIVDGEIGKYLLLGEISLLSHIQFGHLCGVITDIDISITDTIISDLVAGVDLGTSWHIHIEDDFAVNLNLLGRKIKRGGDFLRIIEHIREILAHILDGIGIYTGVSPLSETPIRI